MVEEGAGDIPVCTPDNMGDSPFCFPPDYNKVCSAVEPAQ